jgi:hypothetical protein
MVQVRNAVMKMPVDRRVTTNAGYTFSFKLGEEKFIPGVAVQEVRRHGGILVRYAEGSMEVPESADKVKMESLVNSTSTLPKDELAADEVPDEVAESVSSSTNEDDDAAVAKAVKDMETFNQKEVRIKNAILALLSESDPDKFVATTGMPKVTAIAAALHGENVTAEVRDLVWRKMESAGLVGELDGSSDA